MNLKAMREAAVARLREIQSDAKGREFTADEMTEIESKSAEIANFDKQIKAASVMDDFMNSEPSAEAKGEAVQAKSLGDHFFKTAFGDIKSQRAGGSRFSVSAPEFKAATDPVLTSTRGTGVIEADRDNTLVRAFREAQFLTSWLGSGSISSNAITYFTEGAIEGAFTTVAEGAQKPQLSATGWTPVTESLKKIAGWITLSDEMLEDADFVVSEINARLMYELAKFEQTQLLDGDGLTTNVLGLLRRNGVQTETATDNTDNADAIFRALTKVQTATGLSADGIVINPADYQKLRLSKDANGQYFAGGYFSGQYGNGGVLEQPALWGRNTIVTSAITAGTVLVGAGQQGATVYRKGGIRVEATNTDGTDFQKNMNKIRAEERVALAVRRPSAFVKVTLSSTAPAE